MARVTRPLPLLPSSVPSVLGPVPLTRAENLRTRGDEECLGLWHPRERMVEIEARAALTAAWHTYWHEWTHIALWDMGVTLDDTVLERVCDALATARVRELLDNPER